MSRNSSTRNNNGSVSKECAQAQACNPTSPALQPYMYMTLKVWYTCTYVAAKSLLKTTINTCNMLLVLVACVVLSHECNLYKRLVKSSPVQSSPVQSTDYRLLPLDENRKSRIQNRESRIQLDSNLESKMENTESRIENCPSWPPWRVQ